ncbi:hypothetical protein [Halogeometricum limi]|uniref:Integral membrane protein n=1 Tax=Halogeometricum limi TaxID=555875 RepID=A0A1I6IQR5_9EURY|nr:hypothetical protein [Halogeometricum limi]SFR69097.1 hypothetical protein SAMN04488124_3533 [Halogeometricum limi]
MTLQLGLLDAFGVVAMALALSLGGVALGLATLWDAGERGSDHPVRWGVLAVVVPPSLVAYFVVRRRLGSRGPPTPEERGARTVAAGVLAAVVVGSLFAPPDPISQIRWFLPTLAVTTPLAYLAFFRD